ncbi:polysaccharide deacetylase family protein [Halostella litorea]|uniref:polysaccharide deacetylase family protein n=1 Tax=Halostella litorea TaxID=2528831 RepID=UPI0010922B4D|nr:polysaccharide deacetylase family protein [Halostella litorea]
MTDQAAVLSIDLEFFSHIPAYRNARGTSRRTDIGTDGVDDLLAAFGEAEATGTFFVVSDVAEGNPSLIRRVVDAGHEICSHTHSHRHLSELSPKERRTELERSRRVLRCVTGADVNGFRAPSFDITDDHFQLLDDTGYEYDSSVIACRSIPGWYGGEYDAERPCSARAISANSPDHLRELPVSVMPGLRLPLTGTWLRFFGVRYTLLGMKLLARRGIAPVLYIHPWELVDLPSVNGVPSRVYWRTGRWMRRAVRRILAAPFDFVSANSVVHDE